ncbi:MAG TPA: hypothetical protein VFE58_02830 [Tepidisphaeraceae bacterium]|jgi:hypothetical protein|nr:hypothetical protein [Tepidisphaeraceae bacterium]
MKLKVISIVLASISFGGCSGAEKAHIDQKLSENNAAISQEKARHLADIVAAKLVSWTPVFASGSREKGKWDFLYIDKFTARHFMVEVDDDGKTRIIEGL